MRIKKKAGELTGSDVSYSTETGGQPARRARDSMQLFHRDEVVLIIDEGLDLNMIVRQPGDVRWVEVKQVPLRDIPDGGRFLLDKNSTVYHATRYYDDNGRRNVMRYSDDSGEWYIGAYYDVMVTPLPDEDES